jgi:hypothetical protein
VALRGSGTAAAGKGDGAAARKAAAKEVVLRGVELPGEDSGDGVSRLSEGVRVRASTFGGLRAVMLRYFSKGEAYEMISILQSRRQRKRTLGAERRLPE